LKSWLIAKHGAAAAAASTTVKNTTANRIA
jgi:hypothetical protein